MKHISFLRLTFVIAINRCLCGSRFKKVCHSYTTRKIIVNKVFSDFFLNLHNCSDFLWRFQFKYQVTLICMIHQFIDAL
jgi:hypothetical protein